MDKQPMTVSEAMASLGIKASRGWVYTLIAKGTLRAVKVPQGNRMVWAINRADVEARKQGKQ
jgi:excisionase family DNA binding protein